MDKEIRTATEIGRNKYLMRDSRQMWIAKSRKAKDGGKEYVRVTGYYTSFEKLLHGMVHESALKAGGETIAEALEQMAKIEKDIKSIARKLGRALDEKEDK